MYFFNTSPFGASADAGPPFALAPPVTASVGRSLWRVPWSGAELKVCLPSDMVVVGSWILGIGVMGIGRGMLDFWME